MPTTFTKLVIKDETPIEAGVVEISSKKVVNVLNQRVEYFICKRDTGRFKDMGFYLSKTYDWYITQDNLGEWVLVPVRRV